MNRKLFLKVAENLPMIKQRSDIRFIAVSDPDEIPVKDKAKMDKVIGVITDVQLANDRKGAEIVSKEIYPHIKNKESVPIYTYSGNAAETLEGIILSGHIMKGSAVKGPLVNYLNIALKNIPNQITASIESATNANASSSTNIMSLLASSNRQTLPTPSPLTTLSQLPINISHELATRPSQLTSQHKLPAAEPPGSVNKLNNTIASHPSIITGRN